MRATDITNGIGDGRGGGGGGGTEAGMPPLLPLLLLAGAILALSVPGAASESAELRFLGQTQFVVGESSGAVVRLVVERVGDPVNVTALVLGHHRHHHHVPGAQAAAALRSRGISSTP
ncbi:hypothetical protein CRUP_038333 [Coryphaenoides rupestris]|nr:hypothetical protein CRUP_038333 [Coryphaenoides rupestris]